MNSMKSVIDFNKSIYELSKENPEIIKIMQSLGFDDISKPGMLNTAGRFMTIPKGAKMKGIELSKIISAFIEKGYEVIE
jgi:hypothetical protein